MPRLVGPPSHIEKKPVAEVPAHTASCLSPDGRWLAMIGSEFQATLYDLEVPSPPHRERWRRDEHCPTQLVMAGTPDHGLLAVVDIYHREVGKPRREQQGAQLSLRSLPGAQPLELPIDGLPEGWFELVDELHAPPGFEDPVIRLSTPTGGMLVRRDGDHLVTTTARTPGRLLTAHPCAGLVVSTPFGVRIETSDDHLTSLPHDRPALDERFAFSADGRRAVWLRNRLLTALELDDDAGWTTVATREVPDDLEILGLAVGALLWQLGDDVQLGVWSWVHPFEDLHEASLPSEFDEARLSAAGNAVVALAPTEGRVLVRGIDGTDKLDLHPIEVFCTACDAQGRRRPGTWAGCGASRDRRQGIVHATFHAHEPDDPTRSASSLTLWDLELMRPVQTIMSRTNVRRYEGYPMRSPDGTFAVAYEGRVAFWHPDGDRVRHVRDAPVLELSHAPLIPHWLTPDTLAVTSAHDEVALLFDPKGNRRPPDHFGPWGFQIPRVGRYSATGRRTQSLTEHGYRSGIAGTDGLVTLELQPSTWPGAEPGTATTVIAYRDGEAGFELTALELPAPTRTLIFDPRGIDRGRHVLLRRDGFRRDAPGWHFTWHAIRVGEHPLQLELVGQLGTSDNVATSSRLPWVFTVGGEARDVVEVRHVNDLATVVDRFEVPPDASHVSVARDGGHLQVTYKDGTSLRWRLELD